MPPFGGEFGILTSRPPPGGFCVGMTLVAATAGGWVATTTGRVGAAVTAAAVTAAADGTAEVGLFLTFPSDAGGVVFTFDAAVIGFGTSFFGAAFCCCCFGAGTFCTGAATTGTGFGFGGSFGLVMLDHDIVPIFVAGGAVFAGGAPAAARPRPPRPPRPPSPATPRPAPRPRPPRPRPRPTDVAVSPPALRLRGGPGERAGSTAAAAGTAAPPAGAGGTNCGAPPRPRPRPPRPRPASAKPRPPGTPRPPRPRPATNGLRSWNDFIALAFFFCSLSCFF